MAKMLHQGAISIFQHLSNYPRHFKEYERIGFIYTQFTPGRKKNSPSICKLPFELRRHGGKETMLCHHDIRHGACARLQADWFNSSWNGQRRIRDQVLMCWTARRTQTDSVSSANETGGNALESVHAGGCLYSVNPSCASRLMKRGVCGWLCVMIYQD